MARLLQIAQLGHEAIRQKAESVGNILRKRTQELIDDMIATLAESGGVGIAAPQVYESCRLFVIAPKPTPFYSKEPATPPVAMINPIILSKSYETTIGWEGCLSVPGIRGLVPRYKTIQAEYMYRDGVRETKVLTNLASIIFQHEYDHLDGKVFLDRLESTKDIITEKEYQKLTKYMP